MRLKKLCCECFLDAAYFTLVAMIVTFITGDIIAAAFAAHIRLKCDMIDAGVWMILSEQAATCKFFCRNVWQSTRTLTCLGALHDEALIKGELRRQTLVSAGSWVLRAVFGR